MGTVLIRNALTFTVAQWADNSDKDMNLITVRGGSQMCPFPEEVCDPDKPKWTMTNRPRADH
jgi:hypothetical protein